VRIFFNAIKFCACSKCQVYSRMACNLSFRFLHIVERSTYWLYLKGQGLRHPATYVPACYNNTFYLSRVASAGSLVFRFYNVQGQQCGPLHVHFGDPTVTREGRSAGECKLTTITGATTGRQKICKLPYMSASCS
jgi:hypothetical protein